MKQVIWGILCSCTVLLFTHCGDIITSPGPTEASQHFVQEIITKTYSIEVATDEIVEDTVERIRSIVYDSEGKELEQVSYNLDGSVAWRDEYRYADSGFQIGSNHLVNGQRTSYSEYDVDSIGRRIGYRTLDFQTNTLLTSGVSRYEQKGKIRRDGYLDEAGEFKWTYEYEFDDSGKELGYVYQDPKTGETYPAQYRYISYNEDGEWTKRQIIENGRMQNIEIRTFVPFE